MQAIGHRVTATPTFRPHAAVQEPVDSVELNSASPRHTLVASLVGRLPDGCGVEVLVYALECVPDLVLERLHAFGTRFHVYDRQQGETPPGNFATLADEAILGGYDPQNNVICLERQNVLPFTTTHEVMHAWDHALGVVSDQPAWEGAFHRARLNDCAVRDNARANPKEYLADTMTAWLIPDDRLAEFIHEAAEQSPLMARDRQHYSRGRLQERDAEGYRLAQSLLG